jgi:hypothetical protein
LAGEECESTTRYAAVDGELFIQGKGDAHPVSPDDVSQGLAPDCYLIAALTGLADKAPHLIERMFSDSTYGAYAITLFRHNEGHELNAERFHLNKMIVVDQDGRGLYAGDGDSRLLEGETSPNPRQGQYELWVKMAETAWAGMQDGWSNITAGYAHTGLEALTGKYADVEFAFQNHPVDPKVQTIVAELATHRQAVLRTGFLDVDDLERRLAAGQVVVAGTIDETFPNAQREKTFQTDKLALKHAYYVVSVDVAGDRIVVQNPHGWESEGIVLTTEEFQSSFCQTAAIDPGR